MKQAPYFCVSFAYGDTPFPFYSPEEMEQALRETAEAEREATERLRRVRAAVAELNALTTEGTADADARIRILEELDTRRTETEALLCALREKSILLKEEWEDAHFALYGRIPS